MSIPSVTVNVGSQASAGTLTINSAQKVIQIRDRIFEKEPGDNPGTLLANKADREKVEASEFKWNQDELTPRIATSNAAYTAGITSVVVASGQGDHFFPNCLVQVQNTGEILHCTAVSTDTLTVVRSWGSTAAGSIPSGGYLTNLGGAAVEGAASEDPRATKTTTVTGRTQIWRDGFEASRTLMQTAVYGPKVFDHNRRMREKEHRRYIENAFLWGEANQDATIAAARSSTDGVNARISSISRDFSGGLSRVSLMDFFEEAFRYGSSRKILFGGGAVISNINLLFDDVLQKVDPVKNFHLNMKELELGHGTALIMKHNMMEGNENGRSFFLLDFDSIAYRFLQDTVLNENIQNNNVDGREDEWLTEAGFEIRNEIHHAIGTNAAASATSAGA